jgi:hypothetical protein
MAMTRSPQSRQRERALGQQTYRLRYAGLSHLNYCQGAVCRPLQQMNVTYAIEDQLFVGYNHSPLRLNVFVWKGETGVARVAE